MSAHSRRSDPRARALAVLVEVMDGAVFGAARLAELQQERPLSPADFGLAMELVLGTTRHLLTCDQIAAHFHRGRWAGVHPVIRLNIAMAVYQLCWLDRVPDHAVVDSAVRLASSHGRGTAGRINAILRAVTESRGPVVDGCGIGFQPVNRATGLQPIEVESGNIAAPPPTRWLPIDDQRGRLFDCDIFPDPARRPLEYLVAITSHPPFLVERWHRRFKPKLCRQILDAGNRRPRLVLRPNTMRITPEQLLARLHSESPAAAGGVRGADLESGDDPGQMTHSPMRPRTSVQGSDGLAARLVDSHVVLDEVSSPADLDVFREGLCQPQDSTSGIAMRLAAPQPDEVVVDLCAGSGTKSTQAAELMGNRGRVVATDVDELRLGRISENATRLGITMIEVVSIDKLEATLAAAGTTPDVIVIDAPCSNTGVLSRRPEARYRATYKSITSLVEIQRGLLNRAAELSGPNTRILYSTCSIEHEENESQVNGLMAANPDWRLVESKFTLPDSNRDGGYAAVLRQPAKTDG